MARDIAVPDTDVPPGYWREASDSTVSFLRLRQVEAGRVLPVGFSGDPERPKDMGSSRNPNFIHSWDGGLSTQLTTNGGSKRPTLGWSHGQPIGRTRLTVPDETLRAASLHEDSYKALVNRFYSHKALGMSRDMWLRELVNIGVPVSTGIAIDQAVQRVLKRVRVAPSDHCAVNHVCRAFNAHCDAGMDPDDGLLYPSDYGSALVSKGPPGIVRIAVLNHPGWLSSQT